ncbi:hypothetical protein VNO77_27051 [Canavalia gladiata]|uniref:Uncharacterized protein n=1 Tax=Canavalia gladiata TaxID=3824 RepID=A0AAN9KX48_CANGL
MDLVACFFFMHHYGRPHVPVIWVPCVLGSRLYGRPSLHADTTTTSRCWHACYELTSYLIGRNDPSH